MDVKRAYRLCSRRLVVSEVIELVAGQEDRGVLSGEDIQRTTRGSRTVASPSSMPGKRCLRYPKAFTRPSKAPQKHLRLIGITRLETI